MTARRIVVVYSSCDHDHIGPHFTDESESIESLCKGGPHRRLTEGRYVLIERDENGEWPGFTDEAELIAYDATCMADILDYLAHALAREPT